MSINKAQGQFLLRHGLSYSQAPCYNFHNSVVLSIPHIAPGAGLYLPKPVFAHGQFYIVLFRVRCAAEIQILLKEADGHGSAYSADGALLAAYTHNFCVELCRRAPNQAREHQTKPPCKKD